MKLARLGLYIDEDLSKRYWSYGQNVFATYLKDILGRLRIPYEMVTSGEHLDSGQFDIIIAAFVPDTKAVGEKILDFVKKGGAVLSLANLDQLAPYFGFRKGETLGAGYASYDQEKYKKLRYLKAKPWHSAAGENTAEKQTGSLLNSQAPLFQQFPLEKGIFSRCTVDIAETVVRLQQGGQPLFHDGTPAPDGTAEINDYVLKVDDMCEMDWEHDRQRTETNQPYFAYPYADLWKEVFVHYLVELSLAKELTLPFVWYWPEGVKGVAVISHDSDYNEDEHAYTTLRLLKEAGVRSTWCMMVPGYSQDVYQRVKADGHELAFHYNAVDVDDGFWGEEEFKQQFSRMQKDLPGVEIVSNKNHLTRYEGWGELFEWCEQCGIKSDQTVGPSKKGNLGFTFGTCHPYFPIAWGTDHNRFYDVVELPFLTPDINTGKWGDTSIIVPFLETVKNVDGVAHFLFHQIHLHRNEKVREAFFKVVEEMKKRQFEFWTGNEVNKWERLKRSITITSVTDGQVEFDADGTIHDFIVYIPLHHDNEAQYSETEVVFGIPCIKAVCHKDVKKHELSS
ncbi:hypothetical protein A8F94_14085 [Bacillus sp. FJAT-27225]|uniref:hypothetical protein n=1 Tax=Bacillus sp. FJAT-27225 TaxID=1743144 RepID=UPI00080C2768|nr:hypothetical protein [Bacillus sp. FJAT-27225]OCA85972.1 hypothetical protein A8F94_14085 [Bacillus sp. FJAT-27225]